MKKKIPNRISKAPRLKEDMDEQDDILKITTQDHRPETMHRQQRPSVIYQNTLENNYEWQTHRQKPQKWRQCSSQLAYTSNPKSRIQAATHKFHLRIHTLVDNPEIRVR